MTDDVFAPVTERAFAGISLRRRDGELLVTLDRPAQMNAPDRAMHAALRELWSWINECDWVRGVMVIGRGRAFSAGADRALLAAMVDDPELRAEVIAEAGELLLALARVRVPVVGAVNGAAVGLACSIVSLCDHVLMGERAFLVDPHVDIGLVGVDGIAMTWPLLTGLLDSRAAALLGRRVGAQAAVDAGLANQMVSDGALEDMAMAQCRRLASLPPQAFAETKRILHQPVVEHLERALPIVREAEMQSFVDPSARARLIDVLAR